MIQIMLRNTAITTLIFSGIVTTTASLPAHSLTLGSYIFDGDVLTPIGVDSNVTFTNFGTGPGINPTGSGFAAGNPASGKAINYSSWSTLTFDANDYYTFTIAPISGKQMTLTTLLMDAQRSGTGPSTLEVRSSLDNYTTIISSVNPPTLFGSLSTPLGIPFGNLTTPVTFRIYGYAATGAGGTLRLDNVSLDGSTANIAPVPFTFTPVWGIVTWSIVALRRSRQKLTQ